MCTSWHTDSDLSPVLTLKKDKKCKISYANLAFLIFYLYLCTVIPS